VTEDVLHNVFAQLYTQGVMLEGMIVKPNMVLAGLADSEHGAVADVAERSCPLRFRGSPSYPAANPVNGVSRAECHAVLARSPKSRPPWVLTFSFARAIQDPALDTWHGRDANVAAAQQALLHRAQSNRAAFCGEYSAAMEHR
jgi:fructose-bisphosphate aldolase class I